MDKNNTENVILSPACFRPSQAIKINIIDIGMQEFLIFFSLLGEKMCKLNSKKV